LADVSREKLYMKNATRLTGRGQAALNGHAKAPRKRKSATPAEPSTNGYAVPAVLEDCTAAECHHRPLTHLWYPLIAKGVVTFISGKSGAYKSSLAYRIIADLTKGRAMPDGSKRKPIKAAALLAEAAPSVYAKSSLDAANGDGNIVRFPGWKGDGTRLPHVQLPRDAVKLIAYLKHHAIDLLFIDGVVSFLDSEHKRDEGSVVRDVCQCLNDIAREADCAILGIKHSRKGQSGDVDDWMSGSAEWRNAVRGNIHVGELKEKSGVYAATCKKPIEGPKPLAQEFVIDWKGKVPVVAFKGQSDVNDSDYKGAEIDAEEKRKIDIAEDLIKTVLDDEDVWSKTLYQICKDRGISDRTAERACHNLHVLFAKKKTEKGWKTYACKPPAGWPPKVTETTPPT
jgi:hypothetical protein